MIRKHHLKTWPFYFQLTMERKKWFEVRKNDRDYRAGDVLVLEEWCPRTKRYTGCKCVRRVGLLFLSEAEARTTLLSYSLPGIVSGYVLMQLVELALSFEELEQLCKQDPAASKLVHR